MVNDRRIRTKTLFLRQFYAKQSESIIFREFLSADATVRRHSKQKKNKQSQMI
jgi:hypothetical protein